MKLISSLFVLAAYMLGPQAVSAATIFTPPVVASGTNLYKVHACKFSLSGTGTDSVFSNDVATCGQQAADYFCNSVKGGTASSFTIASSGYEKTLYQMNISGTNIPICDPSSGGTQSATYNNAGYNKCLAFTSITCAHEAYSKASDGTTSGSGVVRRLRGNDENVSIPRILLEED